MSSPCSEARQTCPPLFRMITSGSFPPGLSTLPGSVGSSHHTSYSAWRQDRSHTQRHSPDASPVPRPVLASTGAGTLLTHQPSDLPALYILASSRDLRLRAQHSFNTLRQPRSPQLLWGLFVCLLPCSFAAARLPHCCVSNSGLICLHSPPGGALGTIDVSNLCSPSTCPEIGNKSTVANELLI